MPRKKTKFVPVSASFFTPPVVVDVKRKPKPSAVVAPKAWNVNRNPSAKMSVIVKQEKELECEEDKKRILRAQEIRAMIHPLLKTTWASCCAWNKYNIKYPLGAPSYRHDIMYIRSIKKHDPTDDLYDVFQQARKNKLQIEDVLPQKFRSLPVDRKEWNRLYQIFMEGQDIDEAGRELCGETLSGIHDLEELYQEYTILQWNYPKLITEPPPPCTLSNVRVWSCEKDEWCERGIKRI